MFHEGFARPFDTDTANELRKRARIGRGAILTATSLAASGHPGGSFSSMEIYTLLFSCARLDPKEPQWDARDRIVVSHGHTSPGVYAALSSAGYFDRDEFVAHFRQAGSLFEGHVERSVPGVEWSTGNLGQGLSAGVGFALGARMTGLGWHTFVAMSDGEQHKGQVAEARRLAVKEDLVDLTVLVDLNGIQISGSTDDVMPVDVARDFAADGWRVIEVDGHDIDALYAAIVEAQSDKSAPVAVIADTVIGKGVSFMEGKPEFHGRGLNADEYAAAMAELDLEPELERASKMRSHRISTMAVDHRTPELPVDPGTPRTYTAQNKSDNRSAWGKALVDLADANPDIPIAVLDCDLAVSVKTDGFRDSHPEGFIQCGVGEHNVATAGGALSTCGVLTFWSDFGVFGCDEVYNQQRLNDINGAALKVALTHCGIDVGEDGKTHQALDYVGAFRQFFGWKAIVPADPNQTDRAVRAMAMMQGNVAIAMGRSKLPVILGQNGRPIFGEDYEFEYGRIDGVREGDEICVLAMGTPSGAAVEAADRMRAGGVSVCVGIVSSPLHLDDVFMRKATRACRILTVEDHNVHTGLGASVAEWLALNGEAVRFTRIGVESYQPSGEASDLASRTGMDVDGIERAMLKLMGENC
ncbi:MAG: transketolase [Actinomycetota bacterium]|jgi:transketolase|nr:transketolase [Actinomycetota bacterium]